MVEASLKKLPEYECRLTSLFTDGQSTLVQVMAWCRQATSHYLSQCWLRSLMPYGVTRPQWVKSTGTQSPSELEWLTWDTWPIASSFRTFRRARSVTVATVKSPPKISALPMNLQTRPQRRWRHRYRAALYRNPSIFTQVLRKLRYYSSNWSWYIYFCIWLFWEMISCQGFNFLW